MSLLPTWSDNLVLGDADIDHHHRQLIDLCNRVADFTSASTPSAVAKYRALLAELSNLADVDFVAEEILMAKNGCPMFEAHKAEHDSYRVMLAAIMAAGVAGDLQPSTLYQFANDYLLKHMNEMDLACAAYLK